MTKKAVSSEKAPRAIGPYSQAVASGELLFLSGQIPLDPDSGELVTGDVARETRRVLDNLGAVLAAAGAGFENLLKTTIYLTNLGDFNAVNQVYAEYFPRDPPARATVEVRALPRGARVEIDGIARLEASS
jgi:2-iminobutanoate/2-iminopropanoate deaminase